MRVAIMQPYFLPYIGYYQLIANVDLFVIYDNIKYTKKGWINRNRLLSNGEAKVFTLPLQNASDSLPVVGRSLAESFSRKKLVAQFSEAYRRAPNYAATLPLIKQIVENEESNLFYYIDASIRQSCSALKIRTPIIRSSTLPINHDLTCQDKVIAICKSLNAKTYVNSIGGLSLYTPTAFQAQGICLEFIESKPFVYHQLGAEFVPALSIVDPLMFCDLGLLADTLNAGYVIHRASEGVPA